MNRKQDALIDTLTKIVAIIVGYSLVREGVNYLLRIRYEDILGSYMEAELSEYFDAIALLSLIFVVLNIVWILLGRKDGIFRYWSESHAFFSWLLALTCGIIAVVVVGYPDTFVQIIDGQEIMIYDFVLLPFAYLIGLMLCCPKNISDVILPGFHSKKIKAFYIVVVICIAVVTEIFLSGGYLL